MNPFQNLLPSTDTAVFADTGTDVSFRELIDLADSSAQQLQSSDLVAIEFSNSISSIAAFLGALRREIPVLLSNPNLRPAARSKIYSDYQVSVVHSATEGSTRVRPSGPDCHPDLQLLLSTSGSTGTCKFVRISKANLYANAAQIRQSLALGPSSSTITTLPMHYAFGLSVLNSHLLSGGSVAVTSHSIFEKPFWELFHRASVSGLYGVPTTFEQFLRLRLDKEKLPTLRYLAQAGGKLGAQVAAKLAQHCNDNDWKLFFMYGQTEATARMSVLAPELASLKAPCIGKPIAEGSFHLLGDRDQIIASAHTPGRLIYQGPNVMMGYAYGFEDLIKGDETNGTLVTGDIAEFDSDGDFYIVGRESRFIKIHGNRVCLDTLEGAVTSHELPIRIVGDDSVIVLVSTNADSLQDAKSKLIADYRLPPSSMKTLLVKLLPTLDSGKVDYPSLWKLYLEQATS